MTTSPSARTNGEALAKAPTGIPGLDEITGGGLPAGRPTLLCGGPGCAKTVFAMEILARGARQFGEPGLFVSFEESPAQLTENFRPMGIDLERLAEEGLLDVLHVDPGEATEAGDFSLDGLFIRLDQAIQCQRARRVALDTIETLFARLGRWERLRAELARLFNWLRERDVTTVITGEADGERLTRSGLEAFVSDCVIRLDHRVEEQISTRRLRVVKYRGSAHGADEYPFLIGPAGVSVVPITSARLSYAASAERVATGVAGLDAMLGGQGYFKGSSVLVSGSAGSGKSTLAAAFAAEVADGARPNLLLAFEESPEQVARNMASAGIDLDTPIRSGRLRVHAFRPTHRGLEEHLNGMLQLIEEIRPARVVVDPVTSFLAVGANWAVKSMLMRLLDHMKADGVTSVFTALTPSASPIDVVAVQVSSLMDTWITVSQQSLGADHRRELRIVKSRGMAHDLATRTFAITSEGIVIQPPGGGVT